MDAECEYAWHMSALDVWACLTRSRASHQEVATKAHRWGTHSVFNFCLESYCLSAFLKPGIQVGFQALGFSPVKSCLPIMEIQKHCFAKLFKPEILQVSGNCLTSTKRAISIQSSRFAVCFWCLIVLKKQNGLYQQLELSWGPPPSFSLSHCRIEVLIEFILWLHGCFL